MNKYEQYIINACVANDPSIMEMKFGTKIKLKDRDVEECRIVTTSLGLIQTIDYVNDSEKFWIHSKHKYDEIVEILGRDIWLHDILFAHRFTDGGVALAVSENGEFWTFGGLGKQPTDIYWNLKKPLHDQTEETKLLLANILGFKE